MSNYERAFPDPELHLRDARDFIRSSQLARKAVKANSLLPLFIDDLLETIYRLVESCHLPEFTDHGLPHLCSLIDRIDNWELPLNDNDPKSYLIESISDEEAAVLLIATLIHDIGMLSQNPIDLPTSATSQQSKGLWADVSTWVRQTHVSRLELLVRRIMGHPGYIDFLQSSLFSKIIQVAKSHQLWPWEWSGIWCDDKRLRGLAAVLAVTDLLDEDSARCDTTTLLEHRQGNELNKAHWLRHALTSNRVLIKRGRIEVVMVKPPHSDSRIVRPIYSALRNHFRLVMLYEADLQHVNAPITNIELSPSTGTPDENSDNLKNWDKVDGFSNSPALCYQLLRTFMIPALKDKDRCDDELLSRLQIVSLEDVDLTLLRKCEGNGEPSTDVEATFSALSFGYDS